MEELLICLHKIAKDAPELNMNNFSIDEVDELNNAMSEIYNILADELGIE